MRSTGRQEEKDETNLQIQNLKSLKLLSLKYFTKTEKKKSTLQTSFQSHNPPLFLNLILAFNSFF